MPVSINPVNAHIIVRAEKTTYKEDHSGLVYAEAQLGSLRGKVLFIGRETDTLAKGDYIFFNEKDASKITIDGESLFAVKFGDIIAVEKNYGETNYV